MHALDETPVDNRGAAELPGFLFTNGQPYAGRNEDLLPLIAPIVWPIFGAVMALRYPTQPLGVAANAPSKYLLHFVLAYVPRSIAKLRQPTASNGLHRHQGQEVNGTQFCNPD